MSHRHALTLAAFGAFVLPLPARAVEVLDTSVLTQKTKTQGFTVKLVPLQSSTKDQTSGITCAVTTGQQGKVTDPAKPADKAAGQAKVQAYGPDLPANGSPATTGSTATQSAQDATGNFGRNQEGSTAADVAGGHVGSEQTVSATQGVYKQQAATIGQAKTIQGSWDENSGIRVQNGLTWNQSSNALNLYVQALNLANLMRVNDTSRAATALRSGASVSAPGPVTGTNAAGQIVTCPANQVVNPYGGQGGAPNCLDAGPNGASGYLAVIQAAAQAAALAEAAAGKP